MILHCVKSGSDGNSYILESNGSQIILDMGCNWQLVQKACGYNVSNIDFALVTHVHSDHSEYIPQLKRPGIPVYTNAEVYAKYSNTQVVREQRVFKECGWKAIPFSVPHTNNTGDDPCQNYAYMISKDGECFLYMTDWMYCPYDLSKFSINHFLIAVNYTELEDDKVGKIGHVLRGHASLETTKGFLASSMTSACRNIICCHLSQRNADEALIIRELTELAPNVNVRIAKKGQSYQL